MNKRIATERLDNQRITQPGTRDPVGIVRWFGAVQAQEFRAAKWGLGLRMADGATDARIERAVHTGRILRTHVMRPTWHFVAASDIDWMLELTAPRVHQALAHARRHYNVDASTCVRATRLFERALSREPSLTRAELGIRLARAGLTVTGVPLWLLAMYAELERVICSGPLRGKESTYALLAERAPHARRLSRDEALAELTKRYFRSHGPATVRDFVWWSGLTTTDAKRGLAINRARREVIDGLTYWTLGGTPSKGRRRRPVELLPIYDEYLVAYRDLEAVPRRSGARDALQPSVIVAGQVAGTWKVARKTDGIAVDVAADRRLTAVERRGLAAAVTRYSRFLQTRASLAGVLTR